jgi:hypothetical protein
MATNNGGAIYNTGDLTLESCIFNGNQNIGPGGAVSSANTLTLQGCTFYGSTSTDRGGAVYLSASGKTLTMTGNLFYGNTAQYQPIVRCEYFYYTTINASYNIVDANFDWDVGTGDAYSLDLTVSPKTFRLLAGSPAAAILPAELPEDYPATDFYGDTINGGGAAGAVQTSTANGSGYVYLDLSVNNSLWGSATVSPGPDAEGLYASGAAFTITATPNEGYSFAYWLVDGILAAAPPASLSAHTSVQAVFGQPGTVTSISYSSVSGGTWTQQGDGRRKSPAIGNDAVTKARVSFTSTAANQVITIQLDVSSREYFNFAFISALDNAGATYSSGYYEGSVISGEQSVQISIPVPMAGSHFVDIGYRKDIYGSSGSNCAWFKVLQ